MFVTFVSEIICSSNSIKLCTTPKSHEIKIEMVIDLDLLSVFTVQVARPHRIQA